MKTGVIIAMLVALTLAVVLYVSLVYITREHIKQDRQADATAPCEPVGRCEKCSGWDECKGKYKPLCDRVYESYCRQCGYDPSDPCDTCNRWDECNGVDKENCPMWRDIEEV